MALPTSVKRKADLARQHMAGNTGNVTQGDMTETGHDQEKIQPQAESGQVKTDQTSNTDASDEDWRLRYTNLRSSRDQQLSNLELENKRLASENLKLSSQLPKVEEIKPVALDRDAVDKLDPETAKMVTDYSQNVEKRLEAERLERERSESRAIALFESDLDSLVPNWRTINASQDWIQWLDRIDNDTGMKRQIGLDRFVNDFDASSVAKIFRDFNVGNTITQTPNQNNSNRQVVDMNNPSSNSHDTTGDMVEIWSHSEIAEFFNRKSKLFQQGKLHGDLLANIKSEEARISKAMIEGRTEP